MRRSNLSYEHLLKDEISGKLELKGHKKNYSFCLKFQMSTFQLNLGTRIIPSVLNWRQKNEQRKQFTNGKYL